MFSGIIDHCGTVLNIIRHKDSLQLEVSTQFDELQLGESIAVDGVCLTVTAVFDNAFSCDLSSETLALTHLKQLALGQRLNLERALRLSDRLGGHFVSGHIDQVANIGAIHQHAEYRELVVAGIKPECLPYLVTKGSIAINGVSLTINELSPDGFKVMLIPHTLERSNLNQLQSKNLINIEFDLLSKTIFRQLSFLKMGSSS